MRQFAVILVAAVAVLASSASALKEGDCEVCISVLTKFKETLEKAEQTNKESIEFRFKEYCKGLKLKENRFCYYLGGTEDAATGILSEMSKPFSWGMPMDKVCEKLKKKDKQICELRYGKKEFADFFYLFKLMVRF